MGTVLFALQFFDNVMERKPLHNWFWWREFCERTLLHHYVAEESICIFCMGRAVSGTSELTLSYDTQVQKREMLNMLTEQALKHLHNVV